MLICIWTRISFLYLVALTYKYKEIGDSVSFIFLNCFLTPTFSIEPKNKKVPVFHSGTFLNDCTGLTTPVRYLFPSLRPVFEPIQLDPFCFSSKHSSNPLDIRKDLIAAYNCPRVSPGFLHGIF